MGTREEQSPGMNLGQQADVRLGDMMGTREEQGYGATTVILGTGIKSVVLLDLD